MESCDRHFVSLKLQRIYLGGYEEATKKYWAGESMTDHSFLLVEEEDGTAYPRQLVRFEEGILYDRATYREKAYCKRNITDPTVTCGNYPRYPLQIVEVDEQWGCAKKDTLTVIETRREGESDRVQLSNFCLLQDRETGYVELYLSKIGQYSDRHEFDCETWKYTITLD